jgi:hypothetical protein
VQWEPAAGVGVALAEAEVHGGLATPQAAWA